MADVADTTVYEPVGEPVDRSGASRLDLDTFGRAQALTVVSGLRPGWSSILRAAYLLFQHVPLLLIPLRRLAFVQFAHWHLIDKLPLDGSSQAPEPVQHTLALFESNFNGTFDEYFDMFSLDPYISLSMNALWHGNWGFPGSRPTQPYKHYVRETAYPASYYWSAYPEASTSMVSTALQLERRHERLAARAKTLSPEAFEKEYKAFLSEVQTWL